MLHLYIQRVTATMWPFSIRADWMWTCPVTFNFVQIPSDSLQRLPLRQYDADTHQGRNTGLRPLRNIITMATNSREGMLLLALYNHDLTLTCVYDMRWEFSEKIISVHYLLLILICTASQKKLKCNPVRVWYRWRQSDAKLKILPNLLVFYVKIVHVLHDSNSSARLKQQTR